MQTASDYRKYAQEGTMDSARIATSKAVRVQFLELGTTMARRCNASGVAGQWQDDLDSRRWPRSRTVIGIGDEASRRVP